PAPCRLRRVARSPRAVTRDRPAAFPHVAPSPLRWPVLRPRGSDGSAAAACDHRCAWTTFPSAHRGLHGRRIAPSPCPPPTCVRSRRTAELRRWRRVLRDLVENHSCAERSSDRTSAATLVAVLVG